MYARKEGGGEKGRERNGRERNSTRELRVEIGG